MKAMTRSEALELLRKRCMALVDDDHSLCQVASELKILCHGFSQWKFDELKERYDWIVTKRPGLTRAQLEDLANRWQLARQFVNDTEIACDSQLCESQHPTCAGWDTFSDDDLARFCHEILGGEDVAVLPDPEAGPE